MSAKIYGKKWQIINPLTEGGQKFVYRAKNIETTLSYESTSWEGRGVQYITVSVEEEP